MDNLNAPNADNLGRILIADDEDLFLKPTSGILRSRGYECDCVHRVEEAAECLSKTSYDLLIIDINMPGNRNLEFLRDQSRNSEFLPVIVATGYPSVDTAVESLRLSVVDYIIKPMTTSNLLEIVKSAIQKGRALRKMRGARRDFGAWLERMQEMEKVVLAQEPAVAKGIIQGTLDWYLDETVRQFANASLGLVSTIRTLQQSGGKGPEDICTLLNCSRLAAYRRGIQNAVDVLVQTKNSFKSKELGELRKRLEALLNTES